jgi:methyltransferase (TIGR00027 family)
MREGRPSNTAQRVAIRRAAHQLLDDPPVLIDPVALTIIGAEARAQLQEDPEKLQNRAGRYLRAFLAARSRFAEDELAIAVARGVRQCVILGAGLDTFAYRNPYADLQVFEVDHPATQAWKLRRLGEVGIAPPPLVTFVPVDFERAALSERLLQTGFNGRRPAFFSWLGVTPYLPREAVFATLQAIASISAGNAVVFDYAVPRSSLGFLQRVALDALSRRVAAAGEPFQGFFEPKEMVGELSRMGFAVIEDLDGATINRRYFDRRPDGLRVGSVGRMISAKCL